MKNVKDEKVMVMFKHKLAVILPPGVDLGQAKTVRDYLIFPKKTNSNERR